jgi:hypothetical protein
VIRRSNKAPSDKFPIFCSILREEFYFYQFSIQQKIALQKLYYNEKKQEILAG